LFAVGVGVEGGGDCRRSWREEAGGEQGGAGECGRGRLGVGVGGGGGVAAAGEGCGRAVEH